MSGIDWAAAGALFAQLADRAPATPAHLGWRVLAIRVEVTLPGSELRRLAHLESCLATGWRERSPEVSARVRELRSEFPGGLVEVVT